jgi:hypothetical protein
MSRISHLKQSPAKFSVRKVTMSVLCLDISDFPRVANDVLIPG